MPPLQQGQQNRRPSLRGGSRLYVAWNYHSGVRGQIRVYEEELVSHPPLLETLNTPYHQVWDMTTDAGGNLYVATCAGRCPIICTGQSDNVNGDFGHNGIAVYKHGTGERNLQYLAPAGETPLDVAVGSDGTVYSGNPFFMRTARRSWPIHHRSMLRFTREVNSSRPKQST